MKQGKAFSILPWALLAGATAISLLGMSVNMTPAWGKAAAYMAVMSLILLAVSAILQRVTHNLASR